jgi:hypothetical protein
MFIYYCVNIEYFGVRGKTRKVFKCLPWLLSARTLMSLIQMASSKYNGTLKSKSHHSICCFYCFLHLSLNSVKNWKNAVLTSSVNRFEPANKLDKQKNHTVPPLEIADYGYVHARYGPIPVMRTTGAVAWVVIMCAGAKATA